MKITSAAKDTSAKITPNADKFNNWTASTNASWFTLTPSLDTVTGNIYFSEKTSSINELTAKIKSYM